MRSCERSAFESEESCECRGAFNSNVKNGEAAIVQLIEVHGQYSGDTSWSVFKNLPEIEIAHENADRHNKHLQHSRNEMHDKTAVAGTPVLNVLCKPWGTHWVCKGAGLPFQSDECCVG